MHKNALGLKMPSYSIWNNKIRGRKRLLPLLLTLTIALTYPSLSEVITPSVKDGQPIVKFIANTSYLDTAIELINSAQKELLISHFSWNPDTTTAQIKNALYRAIDRGVKVRVILESTLGQNSQIIREFKSLDIPIKTSTYKWYLHTKLIITDGKNILVGSTNLSNKSINENNETNILIKNSPEIGGYYQKFFNALWENPSSEVYLYETAETDYAIAAPNRLYHPIMKERIANARRKIGLIFYGMKVYPGGKNEVMDFVNQLVAAKSRGVNVRVILEKSNYDDRLNEGNLEAAEYLQKNGIEVRFEKPETITHAKVILVDDDAAGIGSANFAMSGFRYYQEANIIIKDKNAIKSVWDYFENLWKISTPPALAFPKNKQPSNSGRKTQKNFQTEEPPAE